MCAPNTVNKLECIGHVQKRVGSHLRKFKKFVKGLGGKGKLTDNFIDKLQNYYGIAIHSNTKNLANMQSAVIAAFYHCCSSTKRPMHGQCPTGTDSRCKFQKAKALGKIFTAKTPGLPQNILNIVKPDYFKLCDQKLLEKCLHGLTLNANESFNGVLWNIVPKQNFVELQYLKLRAYIAVPQFNEGASGLLKVINKLGFNAVSYMIRVLKLYDYRRINEAERHSLPFTKLKRKKNTSSQNEKRVAPGRKRCDISSRGILDNFVMYVYLLTVKCGCARERVFNPTAFPPEEVSEKDSNAVFGINQKKGSTSVFLSSVKCFVKDSYGTEAWVHCGLIQGDLNQTLNMFWKLENVEVERIKNEEAIFCEDHFLKTHSRDDEESGSVEMQRVAICG
ncbi:uncharacterized protein TNCV_2599411 [Trichonephila clavipes]|uniref:Mutator-like transposase domain-containing protein n=1 Tax=Trichonephila clavipes TaxID=2585209 RepID=A0A8X6RFA2_TRICX|nr:uncharacterized protein TNCV_2599411 [Trichonephila clavipes]